jgi:hypothetical protein
MLPLSPKNQMEGMIVRPPICPVASIKLASGLSRSDYFIPPEKLINPFAFGASSPPQRKRIQPRKLFAAMGARVLQFCK